jgi:hypothetical protein
VEAGEEVCEFWGGGDLGKSCLKDARKARGRRASRRKKTCHETHTHAYRELVVPGVEEEQAVGELRAVHLVHHQIPRKHLWSG